MSIHAARPSLLPAILFGALAGCSAAPDGDLAAEGSADWRAAGAAPICPGSPYTTIQSAIDATAAGGTVTVCAGTFNERLNISKALTLKASAGAATTIIDAQTWDTAIEVTGGGDVVIDGFTIKNGGGGHDGGGVSCSWSGLTLKNSIITANSGVNGGGIGADNCWGIVTNNTISANTAATNGGGLWVIGDDLEIEGNDVLDNHTVLYGGGMYVEGDSPIVGNFVDDNASDERGGGIYVHDAADTLVAGNYVSFNFAIDDGGGVYVHESGGSVDNNDIVDNYSDDDGGGLRLKSSTATVTNNVISRNIATNTGGGAKFSHEGTTITGNIITDNEGYWRGGGMQLEECECYFANNTVTGNDSPTGGGLYLENGWGTLTMEDSLIANNSADLDGGNVYITMPGQTVIMRRVDIQTGTANQGAGIYSVDTNLEIMNTTFWKNAAVLSGGAAYLKNTTGNLTNDVAWGNTGAEGSAFRISDGTTLTVKNSVLQNNTGSAAVWVSSGLAPTWKYNNMYMNTSGVYGMPPVTGVNGNINVKPLFTKPAAANFVLSAGSKLFNAGDPTMKDINGTRADMGIYGGLYGW